MSSLAQSTRRAATTFALVLAASIASHEGRAQTGPLTASPTASPIMPISAVATVAARLVTEIGPSAKGAVIFVAPVRADEPAPRADDLGSKLAALVARGLGGEATVRPERASLATASTLARKAPSLLYLQPEIGAGQLRANADIYSTTRNVWDRARRPVPIPIAHGFATARIDGEVRSYLAPVPLVVGRIDRASIEEQDLVALSCGDIDDDGTLEIATLSRRRITLGRVRGGRFVVLRTMSLRDVSGIASMPLREPVGGLAIVPAQGKSAAHLDVGITDRAHGVRLDADLRLERTIAGVPIATPWGDACVQFQGSTLTVSVVKCADVDPAVAPADIEVPLDAAAVASFVSPSGVVRVVSASRDPRTSELRLREGAQNASLPRAGAQVALADLDQDGAPEIVSTLDALPRTPNGAVDDALVITTWHSDGVLRERSRLPLPAGIRAVAVCPPEGSGPSKVLMATPGELWILRG